MASTASEEAGGVLRLGRRGVLESGQRRGASLPLFFEAKPIEAQFTTTPALQRQDRLLAQILSDVVRTQSSFAFFLEPKEAPSFPSRRALLERLDAIKGQSPTIPQLNGRLSVASTSSRVSLNSLASSSASPMTSATSYQSDTEALWEGLFRLLFVFASLNPTIGYVQGALRRSICRAQSDDAHRHQ